MTNHFMGMDGFVWFTGVVEDRNDPDKLGRVRVRCLGFHTQDKNRIPTIDLPWAHVMHPVTDPSMQGMGNTPSFLVEGSWVVGFFRDAEEKQQPIIMGSLPGYPQTVANENLGFNDPKGKYPQKENIYSGHKLNESDVNRLARVDSDKPSEVLATKDGARLKDVKVADGSVWDEPKSAYDPFYPFNHVFESESGHIKEFDDSVGTERIHEYHRKGTFYEIDNYGNKSTRVMKNNYEVIKENDYRYVTGDLNLTIKGKLNIKCEGFNLEVLNDLTETIGGEHKTFVSGIQSTTVNGNVTKTYTKGYTGQTIGTTEQRYGNTVTNYHLATTQADGILSTPTVTNHHEANVLNYITGEVEFNTTSNFEIYSDATVDVSGATVDIDGTTTNINASTIAVNATSTNLVSQDTATGANNGNSVHGSTGASLTSATAIEKIDPVSISSVFIQDPSEIGQYGSAGGAPRISTTPADELSSPGADNPSSPSYVDRIRTIVTTRTTLGQVSAKYESGGRDEAYAEDTGGYYSYGRYQINSEGKDSPISKFIEWAKDSSEFKNIGDQLDEIGAAAAGSKIDSIRQPFIDKWKEIAVNQPDLFKKAQHDYIQTTHYEVFVEKIKEDFDFDVNSSSNGLQDAVWSTAVNHGPWNNVFRNALTTLDYPFTSLSELTDKQIVTAIYDERARVITQADVNKNPYQVGEILKNKNGFKTSDIGKLIYFKNYLRTFPDRQDSLEKRYTSEKKDALALV